MVKKTAEAADELGEHFVRVTAEGRRMKLGDAEKQPLYHLYQKRGRGKSETEADSILYVEQPR